MPVSIDPRRHDAVLFDLDGVVTDTAVVHSAAWRALFDDFLARRAADVDEDHSPFTESCYRRYIDGKPRADGIRDFLTARGITLPVGHPGDDGEATVCGLAQRKQRLFRSALADDGVRPFTSTVALVHRLRAAGIDTALYSASRNCRDVLDAAGLADLFPVRVDGIDAQVLGLPGKPDPALLAEAARRLGANPARCVVIEDAEAGVTAGRRGGFGLVLGIDRHGSGEALRACGADAVVSDLSEVQVTNRFRRLSELPNALDCFDEIACTLATRTPVVLVDIKDTEDTKGIVETGEPSGSWHAVSADGSRRLPVYLGRGLGAEDTLDAIRFDGIGITLWHNADDDRPSSARFTLSGPDQVASFLARLADHLDATAAIPDDSWLLTFDGYRPEAERLREALCTVGNGYFATRGCAPEADAGANHYPGTYCAGVFNRLCDEVAGKEIDNESMVNLPNWLALTFRVDGRAWFELDSAEVLDYRQSIDLRCAELVRVMRVRDPEGRITSLTQRRFVSMHDAHVAALQVTVIPENYSGTIEFRSAIDTGVANSGVSRYDGLSDVHLTVTNREELGVDSALVVTQTVQSRISIAMATRTTLWHGSDPAPAQRRFLSDRHVGHDAAVPLAAGQPVTVEKTVVVVTGRDPGISEPGIHARRTLPGLGRYAQLREAHRLTWNRLWERLDIELDGNADELRVLRFHLMHLIQTVSPHTADLDAGVPARGLHGEAYRGHIFWDELFVLPVLNLRLPTITRSLLRYRHRRLPEARRAARAAGYRGAMFPWQSGSDGREESQRMHLNPLSGRWNPDASGRAHHVGLAVAYNVWQYYQTTADVEFLADYGTELMVEIARFWVSLAEIDTASDRYVIRGVIGPDEFHSGYPDRPYEGIDNNAYTNVMAVWVIARALDAVDALPLRDRLALLDSLGLTGAELDRFDDVSRRMFVPFHDGVISQFEGYEHLAELDWDAYRGRYPDIARLDRILESEHDDVNRYRVAKQADVLMLFYLLSADELRVLFDRLGYRFTPEQIPRTVDYYQRRTTHGSTLSAVVHSWVLARGHRDQAMGFFSESLRSDIDDTQGGTTAEGIHLAAMAGSVDLLQRCFTGLEARSDRLFFSPMWPESLGALEFPVQYRGHQLHVRVSGKSVEMRADTSDAAPVLVECKGQVQPLAAGHSVRFD